jgi:AcrR family transcriptional regulator
MPLPAPVPSPTASPRAQRARDAIADALLALLREGDLRATAPRIAARAGVSLRSVFHHFPDLEALHQAAGARQAAAIARLARPIDRAAPLAARLEAFVAQRARVYEFIAPVRRAALLHEPSSPAVANSLADVRGAKRAEALALFARELAGRRELAAAVAAVSSYSFWDALRHQQGLSVAAARRVLAATLATLLGGR